ncbi:yippee family protein [Cordyceps fumosorosea ARSEF 2679]|uniref:Yippee family protein n=1 Tax=Cordyceps fumosorosea (strain ARSEF 2679) TaxID=1081104 RepID=A0A162MSG9_CORFA|nr:yippee family protein [Cordyceps fumosorosea ARSEF 2679]OAA69579.1 yippee family protein [Cordyceps fumosorosea ARSEF 2679]
MRDRSPSDTARSGHHNHHQTRISATPPVFPSYLLPSFSFPFLRRRRRPSSPSTTPTATTTTTTTPAPRRLARLGPDTLRCSACSADLALSAQIVSKGFTGRYGRALLVSPPSPSDDDDDDDEAALLNIRLGRLENRQLVTGWHVVADISCATCGRKLGWKYVDAREKSQRYKVGKYILETERDECDEVFAGTWDARAVARRRADMVAAAAAAAAARPTE